MTQTQTESTLTPGQATELSVVLDEIKGAWDALKPLPTLVKTMQEEQSGLQEKISALRRLQLLRAPGVGSPSSSVKGSKAESFGLFWL